MRWRPVEERFWEKVEIGDSCWRWTAARVPDGYGTIQINRRPRRAHRISWEMHYGPIPKGLHVLHQCDNPSCVRPEHLFLGTIADNNIDAAKKGRCYKKLKADHVYNIRKHLHLGILIQRELAELYGVKRTTISTIARGASWMHLRSDLDVK